MPTIRFSKSRAPALLAMMAFAAGGAFAQTAPGATTPDTKAPVVTDAAPPPAEDRDSSGAVVLDKAPVRALKDQKKAQGAPSSVMGAGPEVAPPRGKSIDSKPADGNARGSATR